LQKAHQENAAADRAYERERKEMEAFDLLVRAKMAEMFGVKDEYTDAEWDEAEAKLKPDADPD
jgi:hypothetical protein